MNKKISVQIWEQMERRGRETNILIIIKKYE